MQARVVGVVGVQVGLGGQAALLADAVQRRRVHAEHALRLALGVSQAIVDDAGDHRHVLRVRTHLALDDRGLDEDGLAVRGGHPQLVQFFDGGRDHTGDDARRRIILLDLIFADVQPALDVAAGFGGQTDGRGVRKGLFDLGIGDVHDVDDALLDHRHAFARQDRHGRVDAIHGIEQNGKRIGGAHLQLETVRARINAACGTVLLVLTHEGSHGADDARFVQLLTDVASGRLVVDRHQDVGRARPRVIVGGNGRGIHQLRVCKVARAAHEAEYENDHEEGANTAAAPTLAGGAAFAGDAPRAHAGRL